jgi:hypothetical protein
VYDDNGNKTRIMEYYEYDDEVQWSKKSEYKYNFSYSKADFVANYDYEYENMLTEIRDYEWMKTDWTVKKVHTYYWSAKSVVSD